MYIIPIFLLKTNQSIAKQAWLRKNKNWKAALLQIHSGNSKKHRYTTNFRIMRSVMIDNLLVNNFYGSFKIHLYFLLFLTLPVPCRNMTSFQIWKWVPIR